jgi:RNA polymerase sigma-70 factor, ECF subfamily
MMATYMDLVRLAQSDNSIEKNDAFNQLMQDFQGMAYSVAYSKLSDSQLAEDVTQEAFLTAYKRIQQLKDNTAFPAWLKRIVMTHADRINRRQHPVIEPIETQYELASSHPSPEALLEETELRDRVQIAISALPEKERDVTHDYYIKGESQREISEKLNIPLPTVKKRLQYAREHLRGMIIGFNETIDRAIYGNPESKKQLQPVYIYRRNRPPILPDDEY